MIPEIPLPIWQQISVVIIFAFLLAGLYWFIMRVTTQVFLRALANLTDEFIRQLKDTNRQWQGYFDARSESAQLVNSQMLAQLKEVSRHLETLRADFESHDRMERGMLDLLKVRSVFTSHGDK